MDNDNAVVVLRHLCEKVALKDKASPALSKGRALIARMELDSIHHVPWYVNVINAFKIAKATKALKIQLATSEGYFLKKKNILQEVE